MLSIYFIIFDFIKYIKPEEIQKIKILVDKLHSLSDNKKNRKRPALPAAIEKVERELKFSLPPPLKAISLQYII